MTLMNIGVQTSEVALRNDHYRRAGIGFMMTPGAMELPDVCGLICAVQRFDDFNADNDPYGEHDFGKIEWNGRNVFWKIDYYDQKMKCIMDPLSKDCNRLLTLMRADEY